jgi:hypothetical protein
MSDQQPSREPRIEASILRKQCGRHALLIWFYSALSGLAGVLCLKSFDQFWFGWSAPMITMGFFIAGTTGVRLQKLCRFITSKASTIEKENEAFINRLMYESMILIRVTYVATVAFILAMILLMLTVFLKWSDWLLGFATATLVQSAVAVIISLLIRFWLEIAANEISKN